MRAQALEMNSLIRSLADTLTHLEHIVEHPERVLHLHATESRLHRLLSCCCSALLVCCPLLRVAQHLECLCDFDESSLRRLPRRLIPLRLLVRVVSQ